MRRPKYSDMRFFIDTPDHEAFLTRRCLEIMGNSLKADIARVEDPTQKNDEADGLDKRIQDTFLTPIRYTRLYWASHLATTEQRNE